ncbi:hypothetical protein ACFWA9_29135 [Kitasatospora sp. NPDC059973]|uniref:hypothetical protein n=1 Tax=Kitasatospora sp. NPDC059973 TaxID=3347020 RepID=UPI0036CCD5B3
MDKMLGEFLDPDAPGVTKLAHIDAADDEYCGVRIYHTGRLFVVTSIERGDLIIAGSDLAYEAAAMAAGSLIGYQWQNGESLPDGGVQDWSKTVAQGREMLSELAYWDTLLISRVPKKADLPG